MKNIFKLLISIILLGNIYNLSLEEKIDVIRNKDSIDTISYTIKLPNNLDNNTYYINTSIVDAIKHYKDLNSFKKINIKINIKKNKRRKLKRIILINSKKNEEINYKIKNNNIIFSLSSSSIKKKSTFIRLIF